MCFCEQLQNEAAFSLSYLKQEATSYLQQQPLCSLLTEGIRIPATAVMAYLQCTSSACWYLRLQQPLLSTLQGAQSGALPSCVEQRCRSDASTSCRTTGGPGGLRRALEGQNHSLLATPPLSAQGLCCLATIVACRVQRQP